MNKYNKTETDSQIQRTDCSARRERHGGRGKINEGN